VDRVSAAGDVQTRSDVPPVEVEHVSVRFGAIRALNDVSFTVAPGTIHAVIGPNGAGKSTMFNVLSGVYEAAEGQVRFGDARLDKMRPFQIAGVGVARAFQNIALSGTQSVAENLMLGRHHLTKAGFLSSGLRLPRATREGRVHGERIREIAEFLDLGDKLHTPVGVLSYGDQKRVEVARALCTEPRLLLLDEPSSGLNVEETGDMAFWIQDIQHELGITVLMVEHDMSLVSRVSDRVLAMNQGEVLAVGTPREVQNDPGVIEAYLGSVDEVSSLRRTA
jgi:branched-chain amino acid transport system ATP-binding protein